MLYYNAAAFPEMLLSIILVLLTRPIKWHRGATAQIWHLNPNFKAEKGTTEIDD